MSNPHDDTAPAPRLEAPALAAAAQDSPGPLDRWARSLVRGRLARLRSGRITVRDGWGSWQAGAGDEAFTLEVRDPVLYRRMLLEGSLGAAGAYLDGAWEASDLPGLLRLFVRDIELADRLEGGLAKAGGALAALAHRLRPNSRSGSRRNIQDHYDLGNEFFAAFLDPTMTYSAGIFDAPQSTLEEASRAKLERICRKLRLGPEDHVVEIGTGWGSFAIHAASRYGCRVTTTTISGEQHRLAMERVRAHGLGDRITVLRKDYRELGGVYDKLVSIEMIEAVGHAYLPVYFETCSRLLRADGAMLLQAITMPDQRYAQYRRGADFIQRYVFPGSNVPSLTAMLDAVRRATDLRVTHLEEIGPHYARTLRAWRARFLASRTALASAGYPARLLRLWEFYLSYCEAGFEERYIGDVQLLLEKPARRAASPLGDLSRDLAGCGRG